MVWEKERPWHQLSLGLQEYTFRIIALIDGLID